MNLATYRCIKQTRFINGLQRFTLAPVGPALSYQAGQYILLHLPHKKLPLSIANAPHPEGHLDFIVRITPLLENWLQEPPATAILEGPLGNCTLPTDNRPLLLIAGGTGIAPMNALLNEWVKNQAMPATLLWGVRALDEINMLEPQAWQHAEHLNYRVIEGLIHQELAHVPTLQLLNSTIITSGPLDMVRAVWKELAAQGVEPRNFHSDLKSLL